MKPVKTVLYGVFAVILRFTVDITQATGPSLSRSGIELIRRRILWLGFLQSADICYVWVGPVTITCPN